MRLIAIAMMFWGSVAMMFYPGGGDLVTLGIYAAMGAGILFLIEYFRELRSGRREPWPGD